MESEKLDSSQSFYQLRGLQPGTQYGLELVYNNTPFWDTEIQTEGAGSYPFTSMDPALAALIELERLNKLSSSETIHTQSNMKVNSESSLLVKPRASSLA